MNFTRRGKQTISAFGQGFMLLVVIGWPVLIAVRVAYGQASTFVLESPTPTPSAKTEISPEVAEKAANLSNAIATTLNPANACALVNVLSSAAKAMTSADQPKSGATTASSSVPTKVDPNEGGSIYKQRPKWERPPAEEYTDEIDGTFPAQEDRTLPEGQDPSKCYGGLSMKTPSGKEMQIPRKGVPNSTAQETVKTSLEPGRTVNYGDKSFVEGKVSWFGGEKESEKEDFGKAVLAKNSSQKISELKSDDFYIAIRADYKGDQNWWKERKILVRNPKTGKAIIAKLVDWGPNPTTGRSIDLSPGAMKALGLDTDGIAQMAFASGDSENDPCQKTGKLN